MDRVGLVKLGLLLAAVLAAAACAPVQPWQRGTLAHRCMRDDHLPRVESERALAHMLVAREASAGAGGAAGSGCGCN